MTPEEKKTTPAENLETAKAADMPETAATGLTDEEAAARAAAGQSNAVTEDRGKSTGRIIANNLFSLFNLLNFVLAASLFMVGSYKNMLFLGVVISNILIGTVQEIRARNTIRKLQVLNTPTATVLRNGTERQVKADELVLGDLVILKTGDQVVADGILRSGAGSANESLLTGESDAVRKKQGDELMSGSYITEGYMTVQLTRVGEDSYANRLTTEARRIRKPKSMLMTDLNKLIRLVSMILVPLGLLLFAKQYFLVKADIRTSVTSSVASMLGMIPEGLILLTSVALAVGVMKLGRRNTLVQELYGIETLARVDTLCLDKTGTLTSGRMTLEQVFPLEKETEESARNALARFLGAQKDTNNTLDALRRAVPAGTETPSAVLPFSSTRKKSAVSFGTDETLIMGAPNFVLQDPEKFARIQARVSEFSATGARVLLMARCKGLIHEDQLPEPDELVALLVLKDELRENAPETIRYFREQGVDLKVISGDDPRTVSRIAEAVGLEKSDKWVDATTLTTDELIADACDQYAVFGRVTPVQKKKLVEALKAKGHSVAMTGDGVNDIPALKTADCSIVMAEGSDAARHAAQIVLMDSNFASMPAIVLEGRRVVNNITRSASLFLTKTLFSFLLSLLCLVLPSVVYPFQPIHLTLISSLMIGCPSFVLALEPSKERITGNFLKTVLSRALPGAVAVAVCSSLAMFLGNQFGWNTETCATLATLCTGFVCCLVLVNTCIPFNKIRVLLVAAMALAFTGAYLLLKQLFSLNVISGWQLAALPVLMLLGAAILYAARLIIRRRKGNAETA